MAKTKQSPKVTKEIQFTDEEVTGINELRSESNQIFLHLGQINLERRKRIAELDKSEEELITKHAELVEKEEVLFKELNTKYGDGSYDPEKNVFTPGPAETK